MAELNFDLKAIKAAICPPGKPQELYTIRDVPFLWLCVSKTGAKTWQARVPMRVRSKQILKSATLGHFQKNGQPSMGLRDARDACSEMAKQLKSEPAGASKLPTFYEAAVAVFGVEDPATASHQLAAQTGPRTAYNHWLNLAQTGGSFDRFGDKRLDRVTAADIHSLCKDKFEQTGGVASNRHKSSVSYVFGEAGKIYSAAIHNPTKDVPRFAKEKPRDRVLHPHELRAIWHALDGDDADLRERRTAMGLDIRRVLRLMILLGQRGDEICSLRRDELYHLDGDRPFIIKPKTKTEAEQWLPLPSMAAQIVRDAAERADGEYLFARRTDATRKPHINRESVSRAIKRTREKLGLTNIKGHDMRRMVTTYMGECGVADSMLGRVLNHRPKGVTQIHYDKSKRLLAVREVLEQWELVLAGVLDNRIETYEDIELNGKRIVEEDQLVKRLAVDPELLKRAIARASGE